MRFRRDPNTSGRISVASTRDRTTPKFPFASDSPHPTRPYPSENRIAIIGSVAGVGRRTLLRNLVATLAARSHDVSVEREFSQGTPDLSADWNPNPLADRRFHRSEYAPPRPQGGHHILGGTVWRSQAVAFRNAHGPPAAPVDGVTLRHELPPVSGCTRPQLILTDCGVGFQHAAIERAAKCRQIMIVTSPDKIALTFAYTIIKALRIEAYHGAIGLVLNRAANRVTAEDAIIRIRHAAKKFLKISLAYAEWSLQDDRVSCAIGVREPHVLTAPRSRYSRCVVRIADQLAKDRETCHRGSLTQTLTRFAALFA